MDPHESTPRPAPTLQDVAVAAGVSLATASRVLNGSTRQVAASYKEKVQRAAETLGYTPNLSAQATARGTAAVVALLVADIADPYFGMIAAGVARSAEQAGLVLTIAITEREQAREARLLRALRGQRPRGVILAASRTVQGFSAEIRREIDALVDSGGRVVVLGEGHEGVRGVPVANWAGARALAEALGRIGYRRAIVLGAPEGIVTSDDRLAGFTEGFPGEVVGVYREGFSRESGERAMRAALADGIPQGTVVFAISDVVALGARHALLEAGRTVGPDVALAGFDDIPAGRDVAPSLSTVAIPLEEVGARAFEAALAGDWDERTRGVEGLQVLLRASTPGVV